MKFLPFISSFHLFRVTFRPIFRLCIFVEVIISFFVFSSWLVFVHHYNSIHECTAVCTFDVCQCINAIKASHSTENWLLFFLFVHFFFVIVLFFFSVCLFYFWLRAAFVLSSTECKWLTVWVSVFVVRMSVCTRFFLFKKWK